MKAICFNENWCKKDDLWEKRFFTEDEWRGNSLVLEVAQPLSPEIKVFLNGQSLPVSETEKGFQALMTGRISFREENCLQIEGLKLPEENAGEDGEEKAPVAPPALLWTAKGPHILLDGLKIRTLSADPAQVEIKVYTSSLGEVEIAITGENGKTRRAKACAAAVDTTARIRTGAKFLVTLKEPLYSTEEEKHLYTCRASIGRDEAEEVFEIRK